MRYRALIGALIVTLASTHAWAQDSPTTTQEGAMRERAIRNGAIQDRAIEDSTSQYPTRVTPPASDSWKKKIQKNGRVFEVQKPPAPSSECPRIKAGFDSALEWAMKGARPDVCEYSMWDVGCNNLFKSVAACNSNHCAEKCHQGDTVVIDIYHCGLPNSFKQLVNSYAGMSQASRDECMARLKRQGL